LSNVLITGAGSGFGRLTVDALLAAGHTVAGSMRDINGRNRDVAAALTAQGVLVVEIDVTDDNSVENGVNQVITTLGTLDVVINNAGLGALGLQEGFTSDDFKRVFDVNVFGVQRIDRAVIPHMKARGTGLLIQIASLTGRLSIPFQGPYSPSKWAVEALAELYRVELSQHGIESAIVEPGGMPTEFLGRLISPSDPDRLADYGDVAELPIGFLNSFEATFAANPEQDPKLVADAIVDLIALPHGERPFRTVVDKMGLGDLVAPYNDHLESLTQNIYTMFQIQHLLHVKK
jgi:NAD(P)-dependent dehydrogenase (short-subunit alcohol dehydrogenase family)